MPAVAREPSRFEQARPQYARRIAFYADKHFRSLPGIDKGDLENELLEVLWLVCNSYDPNRGATFNTLFWSSAKNRFLDLHKAASRKMRVGDYSRTSLENESVALAVSEFFLEASAEDEALARMHVIEQYHSGRSC